jgi:hypothetical protein
MKEKFTPNDQMRFAAKAENFARRIVDDSARFGIDPQEAAQFAQCVERYRSALQAARGGSRSRAATEAKNIALVEAKQFMQRLGNLVRHNPRIDSATKLLLGIEPRAKTPKMKPCPQEPPRLRFVRALHEGSATSRHELEFTAWDSNHAKPEGAVRLELFVDLIPPDEPIPEHPGANHGGRPWYLRSYTRSPVVLEPPMARVAMRVVYWGRWADSSGAVGPFSATAAAWIEGGSHHYLPGGIGLKSIGKFGQQAPPLLEDVTAAGPAGRDVTIRVAVIEAQYESMNARQVAEPSPALPAPPQREQGEQLQLEGPPLEEAA